MPRLCASIRYYRHNRRIQKEKKSEYLYTALGIERKHSLYTVIIILKLCYAMSENAQGYSTILTKTLTDLIVR